MADAVLALSVLAEAVLALSVFADAVRALKVLADAVLALRVLDDAVLALRGLAQAVLALIVLADMALYVVPPWTVGNLPFGAILTFRFSLTILSIHLQFDLQTIPSDHLSLKMMYGDSDSSNATNLSVKSYISYSRSRRKVSAMSKGAIEAVLAGESKISARGQVTLPRELREKYDLKPGSTLYFLEVEGSIVLKAGPLVLTE